MDGKATGSKEVLTGRYPSGQNMAIAMGDLLKHKASSSSAPSESAAGYSMAEMGSFGSPHRNPRPSSLRTEVLKTLAAPSGLSSER
jgi:hypothetical protein